MIGRPFQVGITGGIGSGKSIICAIFNRLGIPSYDADSRAKWLMDNDPGIMKNIRREFGRKAYGRDGLLDRDMISRLVFDDSSKIEVLNSIVHPAVGRDYLAWVENNGQSAYLLKEAALIFETGSDRQLDRVITVFAPKSMRIDRVLSRDQHRDKSQVKSIMSKQWSEQQRQKKADYIIKNDERILVIPQVLRIHQELANLAEDRGS